MATAGDDVCCPLLLRYQHRAVSVEASINKAELKKNRIHAKLLCVYAHLKFINQWFHPVTRKSANPKQLPPQLKTVGHKTDWNDIHVAYQVARLGTLSAAAAALDVHHSTVLRRVNALEQQLGTKLFHRHARGYTPTEAGQLLTEVADNTQSNFDRLLGRLQGTDTQLTGTLVITSVNTLADNLIPLLAEFQQLYPQIKLEYAADSRIMKLEHGEAHVSIRPGSKPTDPDYVVQQLGSHASTLYANDAYIERHGLIDATNGLESLSPEALAGHRFISTIDPYSVVPFMRWMNQQVPAEQISFRSNDFTGFIPAIKAGFGAAPLNCWMASCEPGLRQLMPPPKEWGGPQWLVTHVDLHRSSKVQAFTQFIKQRIVQEQDRMLGLIEAQLPHPG